MLKAMITLGVLTAGGLALAMATSPSGTPTSQDAEAAAPETVKPYVLGYEIKRIDGTPEKLESYKGKVLLLVNTASRCGLTPQYKALEELYRTNKKRGLVVLGFPANNFGGQEPGTDKQIAEFCTQNFDVTFPMFSKISVKGEDAHPLYKQLAKQPEPIGGEPRWNFTKFLVHHEGNVVARFEPRMQPSDPRMRQAIEAQLAKLPAKDDAGVTKAQSD